MVQEVPAPPPPPDFSPNFLMPSPITTPNFSNYFTASYGH